MLRKSLLLLGVAFIAAPALAQEAPLPKKAVSEFNTKVDVGGGMVAGEGNVGGGATFTAPIGDMFGAQIDFGGANTHRSGKTSAAENSYMTKYGTAGHLFYRDPTMLMAGVTGMVSEVDGLTLTRYGVETEFYLGRFSILPSAGLQNFTGNTSVYSTLQLGYYPVDNILLTLSGAGYGSNKTYGLSGEYQFTGTKTSVYLDGGLSNHEAGYVLGGVRMSFGGKGKSLIERDRYDDPPNIVNYLNSMTGAAIQQRAQKVQERPKTVVVVPN